MLFRRDEFTMNSPTLSKLTAKLANFYSQRRTPANKRARDEARLAARNSPYKKRQECGIISYYSSLANSHNWEAYALGNNYTSGSGTSGNSSSFVSRREMRATNTTGALPVISTGRTYTSSFDIEELIESLHELFALDRQTASQQDSTRCGICYMHFSVGSLVYREEEGFYICKNCERTLGKQKLPMLRRQQKQ